MKILHLIMLVAFSLYGQANNVLIIRPDVSDFKKVELGIHRATRNTATIKSLSSKSEAGIMKAISAGSPRVIVVMGEKQIRRWRKIQQKNKEIDQIPSILVDNDFYNDNLPNSCIINYEPRLKHYVDEVVQLSGRKPRNIGVIYSSNSKKRVASYLREASLLNVSLQLKSVVISDPETSIKSIIEDLTKHYHVDFMIIMNDHAIINTQNVASIWLSLLSPLQIPVAVPSDYFYELEPRIGSFAIKPHYSEIGRVIASVINSSKVNNWKLIQKRIYTDKSILYFRNSDGTVSKQNQLQNDIITTLHPKTEVAVNEKAPVESVAAPAAEQSTFAFNTNTTESTIEPNTFRAPVQSDDEVKKSFGNVTRAGSAAKKPGSSGENIRRSVSRVAERENKDKHKTVPKTRKSSPETRKSSPEKTLKKPVVSAGSDSLVKRFPDSMESGRKNFNIKITARSANVFSELAPEFPVLGILESGDILEAFDEDSIWYSVLFMGNKGFVSKAAARIVPEEKTFTLFPGVKYQWIIVTVVCILFILLVLIVLLVIRIIRHGRTIRYNCLLIAKNNTKIKYSKFFSKNIRLKKYLSNHGFRVRRVNNLEKDGVSSVFYLPDLICVDWQFGVNIQDEIYNLLNEGMCTSNFILIFYNIPDISEINKNSYFDDRTFFFDTQLTVSDLSKILSVFLSDTHALPLTDQMKSHLEGKISEDTLSEIFQMMDMGKKTGCLLVEDQHPVGMLFFENGTITYAITSTQISQSAVFEILSTSHGTFKFLPGKKPVKKQMQLNTLGVLMEKAQIVDESAPASSEELMNQSSMIDASLFESELESDDIEK